MRVALITDVVRPTVEENIAVIAAWVKRAAAVGAQLALFPEAALTGLCNTDEPEHDLPLGCSIPGEETALLGELAWQHRIYLGLGVLERDGDVLYDSALLLDPAGDILLHYRRIQPQWHGKQADPLVYRQGSTLPVAVTPFGTVTFLLCGDLFDDEINARIWNLGPDYLLFPFSRNFGDGRFDQARWDREEESEYAGRIPRCGCTAMMVNQLESPEHCGYPSFGGALIVAPDGAVLARWPLGVAGMLLWDTIQESERA
ncbi:MAG: carbon-nitrogen hydrolase family protein [Armatimonadota bacterium]